MLDYLIYGKIIIDDIRLADGQIVRGVLGGGGPQAAFGARLWHDSIGFLTRSGTDIGAAHIQTLQELQIDLQGWQQYADIPTPRTRLNYDENEYMVSPEEQVLPLLVSLEDWDRLLAQELSLPAPYQQPRLIHLITEYADEPMVETALALRKQGAILSLEPLIYFQDWRNRETIIELLPHIDLVTPDWPSASGIAGSDDPKQVVQYWAKLGPQLVAIRHGKQGSYVWDRTHDQIWHIPIVPVQVVDPTGAGNSYGGGLCAGWAATQEARLAGCYGSVSAKFLVERAGLPQMSQPLQQEAQRLLEQTVSAVRQL